MVLERARRALKKPSAASGSVSKPSKKAPAVGRERASGKRKESTPEHPGPRYLLASCYTKPAGHVQSPSCPHTDGLSVYKLSWDDSAKGLEMGLMYRMCIGASPSYMCANRAGTRIYVVSEVARSDDKDNSLRALSFDEETGHVEIINRQETGGMVACHVTLTPAEDKIVVTNYMGGSVAVFAVREDGGVGERLALRSHRFYPHAHETDGEPHPDTNPERQDRAHPHMSLVDPSGERVVAADLGLDRLVLHDLRDFSKRPLATMPAGSGPRHMVFHPEGRWLYVLNEMTSTIVSCEYDKFIGQIGFQNKPVSTVPEGTPVGVNAKSTASAIRVSPDGRFVYAANRGHDSIAMFRTGGEGELWPLQPPRVSTAPPFAEPEELDVDKQPAVWPPKHCPRDFTLAGPNGELAFVGNQDTDNIVVMTRDIDTGVLQRVGVYAVCPAPACLLCV